MRHNVIEPSRSLRRCDNLVSEVQRNDQKLRVSQLVDQQHPHLHPLPNSPLHQSSNSKLHWSSQVLQSSLWSINQWKTPEKTRRQREKLQKLQKIGSEKNMSSETPPPLWQSCCSSSSVAGPFRERKGTSLPSLRPSIPIRCLVVFEG